MSDRDVYLIVLDGEGVCHLDEPRLSVYKINIDDRPQLYFTIKVESLLDWFMFNVLVI